MPADPSNPGDSLIPAAIFRAPMRSRTRDAAPGAGAQFGIERGCVGIGEPLVRAPESVEEAADALAKRLGEKAGRMLARFADLPDGTLMWTRTRDGAYHLGRISGPWRYDPSTSAHELGIAHLRPTIWLPEPYDALEIPPGVGLSFARGGRNLQRIHDPAAAGQTVQLWREATALC